MVTVEQLKKEFNFRGFGDFYSLSDLVDAKEFTEYLKTLGIDLREKSQDKKNFDRNWNDTEDPWDLWSVSEYYMNYIDPTAQDYAPEFLEDFFQKQLDFLDQKGKSDKEILDFIKTLSQHYFYNEEDGDEEFSEDEDEDKEFFKYFSKETEIVISDIPKEVIEEVIEDITDDLNLTGVFDPTRLKTKDPNKLYLEYFRVYENRVPYIVKDVCEDNSFDTKNLKPEQLFFIWLFFTSALEQDLLLDLIKS